MLVDISKEHHWVLLNVQHNCVFFFLSKHGQMIIEISDSNFSEKEGVSILKLWV